MLAVDDAEQLALLLGERLVRVGQVAHAEQLVRVAEHGATKRFCSSTRRAASISAPSMLRRDERRLGPAPVRVEAVGAVLPAHQPHQVVEDLALDEARQLLGVEVAAVQQQVLEVAVGLALDGQDAAVLLVGEPVRPCAGSASSGSSLRHARLARRDDAAVEHVDDARARCSSSSIRQPVFFWVPSSCRISVAEKSRRLPWRAMLAS